VSLFVCFYFVDSSRNVAAVRPYYAGCKLALFYVVFWNFVWWWFA